jgi:hypothetical protein
MRREAYHYKEQSPLDHVENIKRYLLIASSLVPRDPALCHFCIRHPDLMESNIIVSKSTDSEWQVVSLLDWQHASILPLFLHASMPDRMQNYNDPISESLIQPSLPENLDELNEAKQDQEKEIYRRRLVHYHYVKNTQKYNEPHCKALAEPMSMLRRRLFYHASDPWEGETLALKVALIEATEKWKTLTEGKDTLCPVAFDPEDVRKTMELDEEQREADNLLELFRNMIGFGPEGWVPTERYEAAMASGEKAKENALALAESEEDRKEIIEHWLLNDIDEEKYM